jgi:hypothetical protein
MKRTIFTVVATLFILTGANAQMRLGVKGGWNFENFDIRDDIGGQLKKDNATSWDLGLVAQLPLSGRTWYLQPEVLYSSQKIDLTNIVESGGVIGGKLEILETSKISYFQVPVNLLYKFNLVVFDVFASGGAYFGYAVDRNGFSVNSLQKTDWGASLGAGVEFWKFQLHGRYNWGLKNISDMGGIKWNSNRFNVSVAFFL